MLFDETNTEGYRLDDLGFDSWQIFISSQSVNITIDEVLTSVLIKMQVFRDVTPC